MRRQKSLSAVAFFGELPAGVGSDHHPHQTTIQGPPPWVLSVWFAEEMGCVQFVWFVWDA